MGPVKHTLLYEVSLCFVCLNTEDLPQSRVHEARSKRLLSARIPHADNKEVTRHNRSFKCSEYYTKCNERGKVVGKSGGDQDTTPEQLYDKHQLCDREPLEETATWETPEKIAEVECAADPTVSVASQASISPESVQRGGGRGDFIHSTYSMSASIP
jgi:hypothetical protein